MTQFSTRFRAIGGASMLAISTGLVASAPAPALAQDVPDGDIVLEGTLTGTVTADGAGSLTVTDTGAIDVVGEDAVEVEGDDFTITNAGTIRSYGERAIDARDVDGTVIDNSGLIIAAGLAEAPGEMGEGGIALAEAGEMGEVGEGQDAIDVSDGENVTITNSGMIVARAEDRRAIDGDDGVTITNSGTITAHGRAINLEDDATITNEAGGIITTTGDNDTIQTGDNLTLVNAGTISNEGFDTKIVDAGDNLTVTNSGLITSDWKGVEGEGNFTLTNTATGRIVSTMDEAVEADGPGLTVVNDGEIIAPMDDAIDGGADVMITNNGLVQGGENDAIELDNGMIVNSGIIESLGSDPEGDFSDPGLANRELDAGIDFDGLDDAGANMDGTVMNMAGGIIRGDIGLNASSGNFVDDGEGGSEPGSAPNLGDQTVVNFGTITANATNPVTGRMDAVLLSFGDDEFQQWSGAAVNGWIDLEAGDDTFILEGASSSVTGGISGGTGDDTAILAGTLDSDNFTAFETFQLGSTLGGTLNDLVIEGNRTVDGNVVHVGEVLVDLGVDSLTATGSITLEQTGTLTIATPLDFALLGERVTVLQDGTGFTNNGASVVILDDDLLLDYTPVIGSLAVQVTAANPLAGAPDRNIAAFGNALRSGVVAGTVDGATLAQLNALPDATALGTAAADAIPSLSEGMGREIFESANLASAALDRHLVGEGTGVWGQIAVRGAEQDSLSQTADGYESDQLVFTVGADFALMEDVRIGLLASYADIETQDLRDDRIPTELNEAESIKLGGYMAVDFLERGFINTEIGYLTGEIDSTRGGLPGTVRSNYDFNGFTARTTAGYDLIADENVSVTPTIGLNAARISFDDVTEGGGFGFTVERGDARFAELRAGLDLAAQVSQGVSGFVSGTVIHDLVDSRRSFRLSSSQIGTFFTVLPLRERDRFELSAGASIDVSDSFAIDLGYLGDFNEGYSGHSARATARIAF